MHNKKPTARAGITATAAHIVHKRTIICETAEVRMCSVGTAMVRRSTVDPMLHSRAPCLCGVARQSVRGKVVYDNPALGS